MFGIQFYPTPKKLVSIMGSKINWNKVHAILEPSAGKGDILNICMKNFVKNPVTIDCVEIDKNLAAILKDKGYNVFNTDFLRYETYTRYDLVIMNPPFADGDKHLLKVLDMMKFGGQVCCILNAETLKNPNSVYRQDLIKKLQEYSADIEYIGNAFTDAEHQTDVEIALIYVDIPKIQYTREYFRGLEQAKEYESTYKSVRNDCQLATNDIIANVLEQYNEESRLGLSLIDQFERYEDIMPRFDFEDKNNKYNNSGCHDRLITLNVLNNESGKTYSKQNAYLRQLRIKYWKILFQSNAISGLLTNGARTYFQQHIESMRNYDFTYHNIKSLQIELTSSMNDRIEEAIIEQFDKLTYQHSMEKNKNVHYYNGWCTNKAYKINKKVIIPCYGLYDNLFHWQISKAGDILDELEKILTYLNGGVRESDKPVGQAIRDKDYKGYNGERLSFAFFDVEMKKKGTIHLWFTNDDLLKKFNIFAGKYKNWLPKEYGTKEYKALTVEEKAVVDEFEGKQEYEKDTVPKAGYYLQDVGTNLMVI